jgi:hypothetical protein
MNDIKWHVPDDGEIEIDGTTITLHFKNKGKVTIADVDELKKQLDAWHPAHLLPGETLNWTITLTYDA